MSMYIKVLFELIKILDIDQLLMLKSCIFSFGAQLTDDEFKAIIYNHCNKEGKNQCPHCNSIDIVKYGLNALKNQRYKCKDCGKYFCNRTNTPMSYSKKTMNHWFEYFRLMCSTKSIRYCAEELKINIATAFQWRHKILNSVMPKLPSKLNGIIEIDEIFFAESFKGNHTKDKNFQIQRPPIMRKMTLSQWMDTNKVSVLCCKDRTKSMYSRVADRSRTRTARMITILGNKLPKGSILCTNNNLGYVGLAKQLNCQLYKMRDFREVKDGQYHIQNANAFGMYIKRTINFQFRGVATKYLNFYLSWLQWIEAVKHKTASEKIIDIIAMSLFSNSKLRNHEFKEIQALI